MADGHLGKCKECTKRDVARHREENIEAIREYDRRRGQTDKRKSLQSRVLKEYRKQYPERSAAQATAERAVKFGKIKKKDHCEICGKGGRMEMHHHDYDQPLRVVFLCPVCHRGLHHGRVDFPADLIKPKRTQSGQSHRLPCS